MLRRVEEIEAHNREMERISKARTALVEQIERSKESLTTYRTRVRGGRTAHTPP